MPERGMGSKPLGWGDMQRAEPLLDAWHIPAVGMGRIVPAGRDASFLDRYMVAHQDEASYGYPYSVQHVEAEESTRWQQPPDRAGNCTGPLGWQKVLAADLAVVNWMLGKGDSRERRSSLVQSWEDLQLRHDRSGHTTAHNIAAARGRRPASPRWSPRFRTRLANEVCVPLRLGGDDVRARWGVGDELIVSARALAVGLRLSVDVDSTYEALTLIPRVQSHPDIRPSFLRSRRGDLSTRGYHSRMSVKLGLQFRKNLRRQR